MINDEMINEQRVSMGEEKQAQNSNRKISGGQIILDTNAWIVGKN
jgi:hypothetical protein